MLKQVSIALSVISLFFVLSSKDALAVSRKAAPSPSPTPEVKTIDVPYEKVNPSGGGDYIIKRLKEKLGLFFSFSTDSKVNFLRKQLATRLAELKYTIDKKEMSFFEKATQRYFTTAGDTTNLLKGKNKNEEFKPFSELLESHVPVLTKLRDMFQPTTAEWRFVEDDINYIRGYAKELTP